MDDEEYDFGMMIKQTAFDNCKAECIVDSTKVCSNECKRIRCKKRCQGRDRCLKKYCSKFLDCNERKCKWEKCINLCHKRETSDYNLEDCRHIC